MSMRTSWKFIGTTLIVCEDLSGGVKDCAAADKSCVVVCRPSEREATLTLVRSSLKEIMMSVDLDEVTSKQVRTRLEETLDMDLAEYKSFIDQEMLVILGQMDAATEIFPHVYLGSEWNASNLEELNKNGWVLMALQMLTIFNGF